MIKVCVSLQQPPVAPSAQGAVMKKGKAIGGCLVKYLGIILAVGVVGIFIPYGSKAWNVASYIGGAIIIFAAWSGISTFINILKKKEPAAAAPESKPADPTTPGQ